ncbi:trypsin-like peptidase domain-containing protein [Saccharopolyspora sp. 5N708]|uniref:trypsin-like peptidase domain-containing protein n=1 Tax=Saccharopolyspora sp. 5N708 TaxID=3457424 RepID=UPI003FD5A8F5
MSKPADPAAGIAQLTDPATGTARGTAFLISAEFALTARHCVTDPELDQVELRLHRASGTGIVTATVEDSDDWLDVALLRLTEPPPADCSPVQLGFDASPHERYRALGYPAAADGVRIRAVTGEVSGKTQRSEDEAPVVELYCQEAAAGLALFGISGGPVLVGDAERAVGVARWQQSSADDPERASGGTFYATAMSDVLSRWPQLRRLVPKPSELGAHRALLLGNSSFPKASDLAALPGAAPHVRLLRAVLSHPEIGLYTDVREVLDGTEREMTTALQALLAEAGAADRLLVYYRGHARLGPDGTLLLCANDTAGQAPTISLAEIADQARKSAADSILLILDCAYHGRRDGDHPALGFAREGRALLANPVGAEPGAFTTAVIEALLAQRTGAGQANVLVGDLLDQLSVPVAAAGDPSAAALVRRWPDDSFVLRVGELGGGRFQALVDNVGVGPLEVDLAVSGSGLDIRVAAPRLRIEPGRSAASEFTVRPPRRAGRSVATRELSVRVRAGHRQRSVPVLYRQPPKRRNYGSFAAIAALFGIAAVFLIMSLIPAGGSEPPPPERFAVSVGDEIEPGRPGPGAGELENQAATDVYAFDTSANAVFVERLDCPNARIYGLDGQLSVDGRLVGGRLNLGCYGGDQRVDLPQPGRYELTITGPCRDFADFGGISVPMGDDCAGSYRLKLWDASTRHAELAFGTPVQGDLPGPGSTDVFTFHATSGQSLVIDGTGSFQDLEWTLHDPRMDDMGAIYPASGAYEVPLPYDGEYTLMITKADRSTGHYRFYAELR